MLKNQVVVVGLLVMACGVLVNATTEHQDKRVEHLTLDRSALVDNAARLPLRVQRVGLEPAPPMSTVARGPCIRVRSVQSKREPTCRPVTADRNRREAEPFAPRRILVGPFTIRGEVVLEASYILTYEMLLRNFSSDCNCVAKRGRGVSPVPTRMRSPESRSTRR